MADTVRSPAAARRALGQRLRELRMNAGLTVDDTSAAAGFSDSKVTKIEKAQVKASREDVRRLAAAYGGPGDAELDRLQALAAEGARKEWWERRDLRLPPRLGSYLGLESVATALQAYEPALVPELLQTPDYARAAIRGTRPDLLDHEVDQLAQARIHRQQVLTRDDPAPLRLLAVTDEDALRRPAGGRQVMRAQLQALIEASTRPAITVLVIPGSTGVHPGLAGPLAILEFDGARPVARADSQAGIHLMDKDDDLRRARQTMNHILAAAPAAGQSLALIEKIARETG